MMYRKISTDKPDTPKGINFLSTHNSWIKACSETLLLSILYSKYNIEYNIKIYFILISNEVNFKYL